MNPIKRSFCILLATLPFHSTVFAQGTAFTYQGRLSNGTSGVNGLYDFRFAAYDSASGGNQVGSIVNASAVGVTNGLFTATLDFGANVFSGPARYLDLAAKTNGSVAAFVSMTPRQTLTPTPYAISAANAASVVNGAVGNAQIASGAVGQSKLAVSGTPGAGKVVSSDGSNLVWVDAPTANTEWGLTGNSGTTPGTQFLGTSDKQPLEVKVNNIRAIRIEPTFVIGAAPFYLEFDYTPNLIGGMNANSVTPGVVGATISGGGRALLTNYFTQTSIPPVPNQVTGDYGTIGGGEGNLAGDHSFIGGGNTNTAIGISSTVAGGEHNQATGDFSVVSGGASNLANGPDGVVPGGYGNSAAALLTFAAGRQAKATNQGAFVWGDSTAADVSSAANDSVTFRASGGYRLFSNPGTTSGVSLAPGGTSWAVISDRNAKKDFAPINTREILEKLSAIPITQWHYKWEAGSVTPHIGPMAQDFKAAFYPGTDDKSITTLEADGVAFAAIQGLNQKLSEKDAEISELKTRLEKLERLMEKQAAR